MKPAALPAAAPGLGPIALALAAVVALCLLTPVSDARAQAAPAASRRGIMYSVPLPAGGKSSAVWDTLFALEQRQQWVVSESLATTLVGELERARPADSLTLARALLYVANAHSKQRRHADGKGFAALERAIGILGRRAPPHDRLLTWAHMIGSTFYTEAGSPELALAHGRAAVSRLGPDAPPDSTMLAQAWLGQGTALGALGRLEEAGRANETALAIRSAMDGPEARTLIPPLAETGVLYSRVGDFDRARALLRRAVSIGEKDSVPRSDFLENSLSRLSTVENRAGNISESLDLALRAYELARRNSGEESIQATRMRTVVAYRLQSLGDQRGAAAHLREIIPRMVVGLGASHAQALNARLSLVETLIALADTTGVAGELAAVRRGLAGQQRLDNSNVTYTRQLTADYLHLLGRDAAARETLEVAIRQEWLRADPLGDRLAGLYSRALDLRGTGPGDPDAVTRMGAELDRLRDSTAVRSTTEWRLALAARAGAEARAGLREQAWAHALEAEEVARTRFEYEIQALPDARALQLMQQLGAVSELLVALARPDHEDELSTAWDRLVRWRGLVRQEVARRRPPAFAGADGVVLAAHARWATAQR
ncbi:MAG: tetratricopeptide repeat protein, partial [Candidatus Eisenbacteria bacterium]